MDSTGGTLPPNFMLTPQQQSLLFAALNSNKSQQNGNTGNGLTLSPDSFENNPPSTNANGFQESPFLDTYNYEDVGDSSFDFSLIDDQQPKMIGDLPGSANSDSADGEGNEKRSHPDDDDDDSNDPKRRESTEKVPKKPGRNRNYRFGSVGEDGRLCLWDFSVGMLHRPRAHSIRQRGASVASKMTLNRADTTTSAQSQENALSGNVEEDGLSHAIEPRSRIPMLPPILNKSIDKDPGCWLEFTGEYILTSSKTGHIKTWNRPGATVGTPDATA